MTFQNDRQRTFGIGDAEGHQGRDIPGDLAKRRLHDRPIRPLPTARQGSGFHFKATTCPDRDEVGKLADLLQNDRLDHLAAVVLAGALEFEFHAGFTGDAALETDFPKPRLALDRHQIGDGRAIGPHGGSGSGIESGNADAQRFERGVFDFITDHGAGEHLAFTQGGFVEDLGGHPGIKPTDREAQRPIAL